MKNSTHLDIQLFGALGISCQDEPYTFADDEIKLTSTDPNDCLVKKLKKDNAEVTSAPFDAAKNAVTLNVAVQLPGASNGGPEDPLLVGTGQRGHEGESHVSVCYLLARITRHFAPGRSFVSSSFGRGPS